MTYIEASRSEFGEEFNEEYFNGAEDAGPFELRGYSDIRRANEVARAKGDPLTPLSHRFQFVRNMNGAGQSDSRKIAEWRAKGYRLVEGLDDARDLGLDVDEFNMDVTPDGRLQRGDQILMVIDAKSARAHQMRHEAQVNSDLESVYAGVRERAERIGTHLVEETEEVTDAMATPAGKAKAFKS